MKNDGARIRIAVLGATGYTGSELLKFAINHPLVDIVFLSSERYAQKAISEIFPHLSGFKLPKLQSIDYLFSSDTDIDFVFCCLPHSTSQKIVKKIFTEIKVTPAPKIIDLSADFRINDPLKYKKTYGLDHIALDLQAKAVYGLTELNRKKIINSELVACPGCYPTASLLPLWPLLKENLIDKDSIFIDAKSGVTGAGRSLNESNLFSEVSEGMKPYGLPLHRHQPEIEQELSLIIGERVPVTFVPHLIPINRGILASIYVNCSEGSSASIIREKLIYQYKDDPFIEICNEGVFPTTLNVRGTNKCQISVFKQENQDRVIIFSVIDNLVKGASGQAIQNMNIMSHIPESTGLSQVSFFP